MNQPSLESLTVEELIDILRENNAIESIKATLINQVQKLDAEGRILREYVARRDAAKRRAVVESMQLELDQLRKQLERQKEASVANDQATASSTTQWNIKSIQQPQTNNSNEQRQSNDPRPVTETQNLSASQSEQQSTSQAQSEQQQSISPDQLMQFQALASFYAASAGFSTNKKTTTNRSNKPLFQPRPNYSPYQILLLEVELMRQQPITRDTILKLADLTKLTYGQVYRWFYYRRASISQDAHTMIAATDDSAGPSRT